MRIGIEAERANNPIKTGVEHYAQQLIEHLARLDSENQYQLYLRTRPEPWFLRLPKNFVTKVIPFPKFWTQMRVSLEILLHPVDVLFVPASAMPIIHAKRSVVTIHDLAWKFYPETFTWFNRNFLRLSTWFALRVATKIIAVSETTKRDIEQLYPFAQGKIVVISHGFTPKPVSQTLTAQETLQLPEKYFLFLSTLQPRKNLEGLIQAFRLFSKEHPDIHFKLVVVGTPGWKYEPILEAINRNRDSVVYLRYVADSLKFTIMSRAFALVLPSFYEGFGMQILEAFDAGIPVLTSTISSMPEVAGDAAIYFDPHSKESMAAALWTIASDAQLYTQLVERGTERLKKFSWERCAKETHAVLVSNNP